MAYIIDQNRCVGCGACAYECLFQIPVPTDENKQKYRIDRDWWEYRVAEMEKSVQADNDLPPLIVHYVDGEFELNDGNHRHQACENLGIENVWAIV